MFRIALELPHAPMTYGAARKPAGSPGKDWYEAETEFPPDAADPANRTYYNHGSGYRDHSTRRTPSEASEG